MRNLNGPVSSFDNRLTQLLLAIFASMTAAAAGPLPDAIFAGGFEPACGVVSYVESFAQADGSPWPTPWVSAGGVAVADIQAGGARLRPTPSDYTLARMTAAIPTRDVEVRFRFQIEHQPSQGVAFLVRHNGGFLNQSNPAGQGYGVFIEGGLRGLPGIGIWKEDNGVEIPLAHSPGSVAGPAAGSVYQVRFRTHQRNPTSSMLQAKFWVVGAAEPEGWQVSIIDSTPALQNVSAGIGIDSASGILSPNPVSAHSFVDNIEIEPLCNPIAAMGTAQLVAEGFQLAEGPLWRGDHLLFTDITGNTIYRLDPPVAVSVFRSPSDQANGMALDSSGDLLAAENFTRSISSTDGDGVRSTLVATYQGMRFNSPNDLDVRADGTLYFSDPDYGLPNPPVQRELPFNGLFRRRTDGSVVLEWAGTVGVNQPNGVSLSPAGDLLFVTDTQQGVLRRWNVLADGSLSNLRILASGLNTPDGMCVDPNGNVYVAVASGIEIFSADGARWGGLAIPRVTSNCAFGDNDGRSLYVTARQGLYRIR